MGLGNEQGLLKQALKPFAGELRPFFSSVLGLRNPLYIYYRGLYQTQAEMILDNLLTLVHGV